MKIWAKLPYRWNHLILSGNETDLQAHSFSLKIVFFIGSGSYRYSKIKDTGRWPPMHHLSWLKSTCDGHASRRKAGGCIRHRPGASLALGSPPHPRRSLGVIRGHLSCSSSAEVRLPIFSQSLAQKGLGFSLEPEAAWLGRAARLVSSKWLVCEVGRLQFSNLSKERHHLKIER